jgi:hypothetical protein
VKVLLDHCVPHDLGPLLAPHEVTTAYQHGWSDLRNGSLLKAASAVAECFITLDKGVRHQQNIRSLLLPVVHLVTVNSRMVSIEPLVPRLLELLAAPLSKVLYVISEGGVLQVTE